MKLLKLLLAALILAALGGLALKLVLIKQDWVPISALNAKQLSGTTEVYAIQQLSVSTDSQPAVTAQRILYKEALVQNCNFPASFKDIEQLRIRCRYDAGFILRINGVVAGNSPNLFITPNDSNYLLVMDHEFATREDFHIPLSFLKSGMNRFEFEIFSYDSSGCDDFTAEMELLMHGIFIKKSGYFLSFKRRLIHTDPLAELPYLDIQTKMPEFSSKYERILLKEGGTEQAINAKIKWRGNTSVRFSQKSYTVKLYDSIWSKQKHTLLNLPASAGWVLYAPYSDKSLLRNAFTYALAENMAVNAQTFKPIELFKNNKYSGLYYLTHKPHCVLVDCEEHKGKEIFYGKIDRPDEDEYGWDLLEKGTGESLAYVTVQKPKLKDISEDQKTYINHYFSMIDEAFNAPVVDHYAIDTLINVQAFIDFILINELSKNVDAYLFSSYFTKEYNVQGTKNVPLQFDPIWDYNLGYGNIHIGYRKGDDYGLFYYPAGWTYETRTSSIEKRINWAEKMLTDPYYREKIAITWNEYRQQHLSYQHINGMIDSLRNNLSSSAETYFNYTQILGEYVWPNGYVGGVYENEIYFLKSWIFKRIFWMDQALAPVIE